MIGVYVSICILTPKSIGALLMQTIVTSLMIAGLKWPRQHKPQCCFRKSLSPICETLFGESVQTPSNFYSVLFSGPLQQIGDNWSATKPLEFHICFGYNILTSTAMKPKSLQFSTYF